MFAELRASFKYSGLTHQNHTSGLWSWFVAFSFRNLQRTNNSCIVPLISIQTKLHVQKFFMIHRANFWYSLGLKMHNCHFSLLTMFLVCFSSHAGFDCHIVPHRILWHFSQVLYSKEQGTVWNQSTCLLVVSRWALSRISMPFLDLVTWPSAIRL